MQTQVPWSQNDELFKKELSKGIYYAGKVVEYLAKKGINCEYDNNLDFRKSIKESYKYKDQVDASYKGRILEIKSRREKFITPLDFPYDTIMIETVRGYDQKSIKPYAYINISQITGAIICLPGYKNDDWIVSRHFDRTRKIHDTWYETEKTKWYTIDELIQVMLAW